MEKWINKLRKQDFSFEEDMLKVGACVEDVSAQDWTEILKK